MDACTHTHRPAHAVQCKTQQVSRNLHHQHHRAPRASECFARSSSTKRESRDFKTSHLKAPRVRLGRNERLSNLPPFGLNLPLRGPYNRSKLDTVLMNILQINLIRTETPEPSLPAFC